jgi:hypothetical protein
MMFPGWLPLIRPGILSNPSAWLNPSGLSQDIFQVDKTGKVSTSRVLGLRRLDIHDPDWQKAMTAITESVQIFGSKQYLCFYERNEHGEYIQIPLDVAAL